MSEEKRGTTLAGVGRAPRAAVLRRQEEILTLLKHQGSVSVTHLAERLGCSTATIRRDLLELQATSGLRRFHGAVAVESLAMESEFQERLTVADDEKRAIAEAVVAHLTPGQVLGLNGGTTTTQIAQKISEVGLQVTVVTNAVNIAFQLTASRVPVVVVGGALRPANYETTGPLAIRALSDLHLDWAILGANGLDPQFGASTHTEAEASVGQAFGDQADRVLFAVDHSKLGKTALFRMLDWRRIDAVACGEQGQDVLNHWGLERSSETSGGGIWTVSRHA